MTPQQVLASGGVIIIPTDTVYGLACLPDKAPAVARIFELKRRGRDLALPVLCASLTQAAELGRLPAWAAKAWPGPVTLVVARTAASAPWDLGDETRSIGLRVPKHPLVQGLASELGPLVATSANRHGEPTPATAREVLEVFEGEVELAVDGGRLPGEASTVIDCRAPQPKVLRQGAVTLASLLA